MKLFFACDHNGIEMKASLIDHVKSLNREVKDLGISSDSSLDYVDITQMLVKELQHDDTAFGVIICGSGQGVSIAANRSNKIRAAMCRTEEDAISVRSKLNANVLCLGSKNSTLEEAISCLDTFLTTEFKEEKHGTCVAKLTPHLTSHRYDGVNLIARAIIIHQEHILLTTVTENNKDFASDLYFLPGGHVEYKESAIDALKRELKEEMDVNVSSMEFAGALECTWDRKGKVYHELDLIYKVQLPDLDLQNPPKPVDHAFHQFVWRPLSELKNYKILPHHLIPLILESIQKEEGPSLFYSEMLREELKCSPRIGPKTVKKMTGVGRS
jgi:RpiB/LacA/LacB family sugar-phosphate isomerase